MKYIQNFVNTAKEEIGPFDDTTNAAPPAAPKIPTNSVDHQETMFNAKKAIAKNPAVRAAVIAKMKSGGYDTSGL